MLLFIVEFMTYVL